METDAMYVNRVAEVAWMVLRTYPLLQLAPGSFGQEWHRKWDILDDSFRVYVGALARLGKKVADAVIALIDSKFDFSPGTTYYKPEFGREIV
jgi:hypothetical protein